MIFLRHIRPVNLLIILLMQWITMQFVLKPTIWQGQFDTLFSIFVYGFSFLSVAAGYIINDWYDWEIDRINHPEKATLSKKHLLIYYFFFIGFHFLWVSIGIIQYGFSTIWFVLFWISNVLQWFYSFKLKCSPLFGNVLVAFFGSYYIAIVLVGQQVKLSSPWFQIILIYLLIFSFLSTLWREVAKDIEDTEGDKECSCRTFPVSFGFKTSKKVLIGIGWMFFLSLIVFDFLFWKFNFQYQLYFLGLILIPFCIVILKKTHQLTYENEAKTISKLLKIFMLLGLVLVVV